METFNIIAAVCLFVIMLMVFLAPFMIIDRLNTIIKLLKVQDEREVMRDYKQQRKPQVEEVS